ncbi:exosortase B [Ferribacterium limneticum]|uniref:exosortase B n=1 Tax=Ferribacterium limneticum TaxID=76259 RepID=UPI001CF84FC7|nr:exosortase B [Ferribacterium limneticum]UCV24652.1 exosortase B [Ferribacterium limneticum]
MNHAAQNGQILPAQPRLAIAEWFPIFIGLIALYVPTWVDLSRTIWATEAQAHGPIILGVALWFFWKQRLVIHEMPTAPSKTGWPLFILGLLLYAIGRSQDILLFEVGSQIIVIASLLLILRGWAALGAAWFPLFFLLFMIPLPGAFVDALTLPMKMAVSYVAENVLYWVGYPISRSGVILQIGQYKLLVADACAGLQTLFTLEALGLLYLNIVRHDSFFRNVTLAIFIIPISFTANVIRVMVLTLITYHFGDEAGQGFLHGFAGMVLFITALLIIMGVDSLLQLGEKRWRSQSATVKA